MNTEYRENDYSSWRNVFNLLLNIRAPEPIVVALDEFQYLADDEKGLAVVASELNAAWEQTREVRPFVLVLSGSSVGVLESLAAGGAPLYGRFSWIHKLEPFDYAHAAEMSPFRSLREQAITYGIYGGTPRYLSTLVKGPSLGAQVSRSILSPRGEVRTLIESALLQEEGLRETQTYSALLRAIGSGATRLNDIAQNAGVQNNTSLRDKLERLISIGYIEAHRNLGAKRTEAYRYRLSDPAFMFYYTFVAHNETTLIRYGASRFWKESVVPRLDTYMGHVFERMVEQAYTRYSQSTRYPMVTEWGRWEGQDRDGRSIELDIAAHIQSNRVLTGAVKWNRKPIGPEVYINHLKMLDRLSSSNVEWAHRATDPDAELLFVAAGGFSTAFKRVVKAEKRRVRLWALEDIYGVS